MPVLDRVAKFQPLQPGCAKITLNRFNALQLLGPNYAQRIELLVVRKNEAPLADWHSPAPDGFISIIPKNPRQHAMDFEFEVGSEVVNPMAFDNSGDYILRIRDVNGVIMSCSVAMQGSPRAGSVFQNGANLNPLNAQGKVQPPKPAAPLSSQEASNLYMAPGQAGGPGATAAGAAGMAQGGSSNLDAATSGGGNAIKIIAVLVVVFVLLGGAGFFFRNEIASLLGLGSDTQAEQTLAEANTEEDAAQDEAKDEASAQEAAQNGALAQEQVAADANKTADAAVSAPATATTSTTNAASLTADKACSLAGNQGDDRTVLSQCLGAKPSQDQLNNLMREAMQGNRCEIALKILSSKSRSANGGNYAYVYGLMADPNVRGGTKCIVKKTEDANYWYEQAKKDPNFDRAEAIKLANFLVM